MISGRLQVVFLCVSTLLISLVDPTNAAEAPNCGAIKPRNLCQETQGCRWTGGKKAKCVARMCRTFKNAKACTGLDVHGLECVWKKVGKKYGCRAKQPSPEPPQPVTAAPTAAPTSKPTSPAVKPRQGLCVVTPGRASSGGHWNCAGIPEKDCKSMKLNPGCDWVPANTKCMCRSRNKDGDCTFVGGRACNNRTTRGECQLQEKCFWNESLGDFFIDTN